MQSRCSYQRFFLCGFTEIDCRFIELTGNFLIFPPPIFRFGVLRQGAMNPIR
jgi:hypothetical protein